MSKDKDNDLEALFAAALEAEGGEGKPQQPKARRRPTATPVPPAPAQSRPPTTAKPSAPAPPATPAPAAPKSASPPRPGLKATPAKKPAAAPSAPPAPAKSAAPVPAARKINIPDAATTLGVTSMPEMPSPIQKSPPPQKRPAIPDSATVVPGGQVEKVDATIPMSAIDRNSLSAAEKAVISAAEKSAERSAIAPPAPATGRRTAIPIADDPTPAPPPRTETSRRSEAPTPEPPKKSSASEIRGARPSASSAPRPAPARPTPGLLDTLDPQVPPPSVRSSASLLDTLDPEVSGVDGRGRSGPLYAPRRPKPQRWRPPWYADIGLGLVPGGRMMAAGEAARGVTFASIGIFALVPAIWVIAGWGVTARKLDELSIDRSWLLLHAAVVVVSLTMFELLRFSSAFDAKMRGPKLNRALAAFVLPSIGILILGPKVVAYAPAAVETAWFLALISGLGGSAAGLALALDLKRKGDKPDQKKVAIIGGVGAALMLVALLIVGFTASSTLRVLAALAHDAGFQFLPALLSSFAF